VLTLLSSPKWSVRGRLLSSLGDGDIIG
jgi:hypothetical protein